MIIWLAMLIPFIGCGIAYKLWQKQFVWWEFIIPTVVSALFILITKFTVEKTILYDNEYMGGIIVEARYYESWSSWVNQTCTRTYSCDCDNKGNCKTCTETYDCSYCDDNSEYWEAYDDQGHSWKINQADYLRLKQQWKATPQFVDQNRNINNHYGCGKDGDMYSIKWGGDILSSESSTWSAQYDNHVQVSKSIFGLGDVSKEEAKKYGLYEYPEIDRYSQKNILGLDSLKFIELKYKLGANKMFEYLNGNYGPKRKIRIYVLLFNNKSIDVAIKQKYYWDGGNKNEVVICIDVDKNTGNINWVYPFTWTENKRIEVDLREDISNLKTLNFTAMYHIVDTSTKDFVYRDFNQFNYLSIDPPTWEIWFVYLITILITIGTLYYGYQNEFQNNE